MAVRQRRPSPRRPTPPQCHGQRGTHPTLPYPSHLLRTGTGRGESGTHEFARRILCVIFDTTIRVMAHYFPWNRMPSLACCRLAGQRRQGGLRWSPSVGRATFIVRS